MTYPQGNCQASNSPTRRNPLASRHLPPALAHMRPHIEKLPQSVAVAIVTGGLACGLTDDAISAGIIAAVQFAAEPTHRCAACLCWCQPPFLPVAGIIGGGFRFFAVCAACEDKILQGRGTAQMKRNLLVYGWEVER